MKNWIDMTWRVLLAAGLLAMGMGMEMAVAQTLPTSQTSQTSRTPPAPETLYQDHCAVCHHPQRTGAMGPALLPESLSRLRRPEAARVIAQGRVATQMPAFHEKLSADELQALAQWIYTPVVPVPTWTDTDIRNSRVETAGARAWPAQPQWRADPMNLFVVVEGGDHHISLVDGDRFEVIHRFPSRYALHGGPKFTPDGRFVYFGSRDGWITKYDLWNLRVVAEVRAGLNMRNVAVSGDGRWVMAANFLPQSVVLFDEQLRLVRHWPTAAADGKTTSRVSAVYDATPRKSFVAAMKDTPEIWEIAWDGSRVRRTVLDEPLDDFFFDQSYRHAMGATRKRADGTAGAQVVDLEAQRKVAELPIAGMPHLGSGITFAWNGTTVLASPNLESGSIDVIDMKTWKSVRSIATPGPGFFMRSHEKTPYAWTDSMMSPAGKDTLTIVDKRTLEVVARVREPGRTLAHIEFSRDGRHALASVWEMDGALVIYDAETFREVKRLPMRRPVGKYNVWNKITRSEGTSH